MRITLRQLEILLQVAKSGSMREAARVLCVTQPAITKQVRALEDIVGEKLITYVNNQSQLTDTAKRLLPAMTDVMNTVARLEEHIVSLQSALSLTVITSASLEDLVIASYQRMASDLADVSTTIKVAADDQLIDQYYMMNAHMLLATQPIVDKTLLCEKLIESQIYLVCAPNYPLAYEKFRPEDCADYRLLIWRDETPFKTILRSRFGISSNKLALPTIHSVKKAVVAGLGFAFLPHYLVASELRENALVSVSYPKPLFFSAIYLAYQHTQHESEPYKKLIASLKSIVVSA